MVSFIRIVMILSFLLSAELSFSFGRKRPPSEDTPPPPVVVNPPPPTPPPVVIPPSPPPVIHSECVIFDAGHGDHDPGAHNASYLLNEKDVALNFVLELKKLFSENDLNAKFTRETDVFIPLQERVRLANASGCDYFVSIHLNSFNTKAEGFETYYGRENSKLFAQKFHSGWSPWMNSPNRGVKQAQFAVIRALNENSIMTAEEMEMVSFFNVVDTQAVPTLKSILVELYFIDNNREVDRYLNEIRLAQGVFESLKDILVP